jgi:formamidopyrimidine-DNA glycosylase
VPELPEVETVRRMLEPVMRGSRFRRVIVNRPNLRIPFPHKFADRLRGKDVNAVERRGKYLTVRLSSGETLIMHLGMSGWFTVAPTGDRSRDADPHDHVIFVMSSGHSIVFNDPRRFGFMDLARAGQFADYPSLRVMGPEPLSPRFNADALARTCRGKRTSLKVALLDQRIVAGVGNIYASEILFRAGVRPTRRGHRLSRVEAARVALETPTVLKRAVELRGTSFSDYFDVDGVPGEFQTLLWVYDREGQPCLRCGSAIRCRVHGGRSSFYCPSCQR